MAEHAHEWVERTYGLSLSDFQRRAVDLLCSSQGCGPYDLRCWEKADWNYGLGVRFVLNRPRLSTFDGSSLTTLVIGAHDEMIRVEIDPCNFSYLAVCMWPRQSRDGDIFKRHPTIECAVDVYRRAKGGNK